MIRSIFARIRQGYHTIPYPGGPLPEMPPLYAGRPVLSFDKCMGNACDQCAMACPTGAIGRHQPGNELSLDTGRCVFCRACADICPSGAIRFTDDFRLASNTRRDLVITGSSSLPDIRLEEVRHRLFARSLKLRQVSAGGCNACEADTNVLGTIGYDLGRFGIQFVASPRHADGILVTGPVSNNMKEALLATYEAVPAPKLVIATGACAISGGLFHDHVETGCGIEELVPVDLFVPGCPPHPMTILEGLLGLVGQVKRSG